MLDNKKLFKYVNNDKVLDYSEGLKIGSDILLKNNIVTKDFYNALIKQTEELGPYYILRDGMAMAHTKIGPYNLKTDLSVVVFENPIVFSNDKKVSVLITLSTLNAEDHMNSLQEIVKYFSNSDFFEKCKTVKSYDEWLTLLEKFKK